MALLVAGCGRATTPTTSDALRLGTAPTAAPNPSVTTTARSTGAPTTRRPSTTAPPSHATIAIVCRDEWGAAASADGFVEHVVDRITIHHTAVAIEPGDDIGERARGHQAYHQSLGWPDLAYHYLIGPDGSVLEGRPTAYRGDTATDYDPTGHLLICLEGSFDVQQPTPEAVESLNAMTAWGCRRFGIDPQTVQGHRDVASTTCPGDAVAELIDTGALAADVVASPTVELGGACV